MTQELKKWMLLLEKARQIAVFLCDESRKRQLEQYYDDIAEVLATKNPTIFQKRGISA
jgi:hypothetical protein